MTDQITISVSQLPVTNQIETLMRWNCDEYMIAYNRKTRVLTVEDFEGFEDDGEEITTVITDAAEIAQILKIHNPGWIGLDGFVSLAEFYGDRWKIGTEAI